MWDNVWSHTSLEATLKRMPCKIYWAKVGVRKDITNFVEILKTHKDDCLEQFS